MTNDEKMRYIYKTVLKSIRKLDDNDYNEIEGTLEELVKLFTAKNNINAKKLFLALQPGEYEYKDANIYLAYAKEEIATKLRLDFKDVIPVEDFLPNYEIILLKNRKDKNE